MKQEENGMAGVTLDTMKSGIDAALGRKQGSLGLVNANVVDVMNCEIIPNAVVVIDGGRIAAVQRGAEAKKINVERVVDCGGKYLIPGLMDAHVHIESTLLTPAQFAAAVLPCGTTRVVADPHEIANVGGALALRYMFDEAAGLPVSIHFALPSCVPCTPFEDAGAELTATDLEPFLHEEKTISLGEVMNCPGVLNGDDDLLAKIRDARNAGLAVDGHSPGLTGAALQAYAGCGVLNDHECGTPEEMKERIAAGMYVFIREGSAARNLDALLKGITPANAHRCAFCTDDLHAGDILAHGYINHILAKAVKAGIPAPVAVSMATINPATCYGLSKVGAVAPGYAADLCLVEDLESFRVLNVWCAGREVVKDGKLSADIASRAVPAPLLDSVHLGAFSADSLKLPVPSGRAHVIAMQPHSLVSDDKVMSVMTEDGCFSARRNPGLCKVAVVERHKGSGKVGLGILAGYVEQGKMLGGALATSIAHDSHNIVCAGDSDEDMAAAIEAVSGMHGGIALVRGGKVVASLALPVAGLMSTETVEQTAQKQEAVFASARTFAVSRDIDAVMSLSFMSLCVIPALKVNTRGLFDVNKFSFVPVDIEKIEKTYNQDC